MGLFSETDMDTTSPRDIWPTFRDRLPDDLPAKLQHKQQQMDQHDLRAKLQQKPQQAAPKDLREKLQPKSQQPAGNVDSRAPLEIVAYHAPNGSRSVRHVRPFLSTTPA